MMSVLRVINGVSFFLVVSGLVLPPAYGCHPTFLFPQHAGHAESHDELLRRGLVALQENRLQEALDALTKAEEQRPEDGQIKNFRGVVLARLAQTSEARAEYQAAIRCNPQLEDAYRNLGFLEWTEHRLGEARETLEHALRLEPHDSFARHYLGRVLLDAKLYGEGIKQLEQSDVAWAADSNFLIQVATGYISLEKREEARKALRRLDRSSLSELQSAQVASLFLAAQESAEAIDLLSQVNNRKPPGWARFDLALANLESGRYEKALEEARAYADMLQAKESKASDLAPAWSVIGIAEARLGHSEQAVDALRRAAAGDPRNEEGWMNLTRELMERNLFADAISAAQEGIVALPDSYALRLRLGSACLAAGRYDKAEELFRGLASAGDPLPTSYVGLAQVLLRQGRAEEAASELDAAQKRIGPNFLLSYFLGLSLERSGRQSEALSSFSEAVRLNPNNAEAHFGVGKMELALGRPKDAVAELEETLRLSPANQEARHLLPLAYRRAGGAAGESRLPPISSEALPQGEENQVGDFLLPSWQLPAEEINQSNSWPSEIFDLVAVLPELRETQGSPQVRRRSSTWRIYSQALKFAR